METWKKNADRKIRGSLLSIVCLPKCRDKSGEIKLGTVVLDYERDGLDYSTACESVMFGGKKMKKQGVGSIESIRPPHA